MQEVFGLNSFFMQNKKVKLRYVDTMSKNYKKEILWRLLNQWYDIDTISDPDYVIHGGMGSDFIHYPNSVLIQVVGENIVPDFNVFDYAIGFDYIQFDDRYIRIPLYFFYDAYHKILKNEKPKTEGVCNRKFCSFVVSNARHADPMRDNFFKALCSYKKVDSAGKHLNNVGGGYLHDKLDFISHYKFNIAFENCASRGYTTEKIVEPMAVNTIPIYWGNPLIERDFNKESFICLNDFPTIQECINYIQLLDENDDLYLNKLMQPWLHEKNRVDYEANLKMFFDNIFGQSSQSAKRINRYGRQSVLEKKLMRFYEDNDPSRSIKYKFKKILKF